MDKDDDEEIIKIESTQISWKEGKNITV